MMRFFVVLPPHARRVTSVAVESLFFAHTSDRFHAHPYTYLNITQELIERRRVRNYEREAARWDRVAMEQKFEDIKLQELKESEIPALNRSSVKYNMINLQYEDSYDGAELKYRDDVMKRNMAMAANRGLRHMKSSVDYDPITGLPTRSKVPVPPAPVAPGPRPEKVDPREGMEHFRVDSLYVNEKESHEGVGRQRAY